MLATFLSKPLTFEHLPRNADLPLNWLVFWLTVTFIWAASGWLAHAYMMYDIRKRRLLYKDDHDLVWTCMAVAPIAVFIAFLMAITPDDGKERLP